MVIFEEIIFAETPLMDCLDELRGKVDVSFFYGSRDWMNLSVDETPIARQLEDLGFPVYYIERAGHHLYFGNPEDLVSSMQTEILHEREGLVSPIR